MYRNQRPRQQKHAMSGGTALPPAPTPMNTSTRQSVELHPDNLAELRRSGLSDDTIFSMNCSSAEANNLLHQDSRRRCPKRNDEAGKSHCGGRTDAAGH